MTAVEFLVNQLEQNKFITESQIHIAKEMEKEQQGYSDEEVIYLLNSLQNHYSIYKEIIYVDKWFEQFKKK